MTERYEWEEPMPWMEQECPYGVRGCGCHGIRRDHDPNAFKEWMRMVQQHKYYEDAYAHYLRELDGCDFEVDRQASKMTLWQKLKLCWRYVW